MLHWFIVTVACLLSCDVTMSEPNITTSSGQLKGLTKTTRNGPVIQFLGVPYAEAPIEERRFLKPTPFVPRDFAYKANRHGYVCPQSESDEFTEAEMSEDCLTLDIYIPGTLYPETDRTIMVWIHGGAFTSGSGTTYDGSQLALRGDVIVVAINYRLGLLGFFSSGDGTSPGNYGLWDQKLAIEWVKNNAKAFGGDPNSITIFGESAGAKSVTLQSLSLLNKGLFHRAIAQSDYLLQPNTLSTDWKDKASTVSKMLDCSLGRDFMACLRGKSTSEILHVQDKLTSVVNDFGLPVFNMQVGPVQDNDFLMGSPEELVKQSTFQLIDFMAGFNDGDGGTFAYALYMLQYWHNFNITKGIPTNIFCDVIAKAIGVQLTPEIMRAADDICERYTVKGDLIAQSRAVLDALTHATFAVYTIRLAKDHSLWTYFGNTYLYQFSHVPSFPILPRLSWQQGANHADEIPFEFGWISEIYQNYSSSAIDREKKLEKSIMDYFANFAKHGDPNSPDLPYWPPFQYKNNAYMNLNLTLTSGVNVLEDDVKFWDELQGRIDPIMTAGAGGNYERNAFLYSVFLLVGFLDWAIF